MSTFDDLERDQRAALAELADVLDVDSGLQEALDDLARGHDVEDIASALDLDAGIAIALASAGLPTVGHDKLATPLRCFLAYPITGNSSEKTAAVSAVYDSATSVLAEFGILTLQPMLDQQSAITPPRDPLIDERLIATSDIVFIVLTPPTRGAGVVAAIAQRYRKHLILATSDLVVSPLLTLMEPSSTVLGLDAVNDQLRRHLDRVLPSIEKEAKQARQEVLKIEAEIREIRAELLRLRELIARYPVGEAGRPDGDPLTPARLQELVSCPELAFAVTDPEVREIRELRKRLEVLDG